MFSEALGKSMLWEKGFKIGWMKEKVNSVPPILLSLSDRVLCKDIYIILFSFIMKEWYYRTFYNDILSFLLRDTLVIYFLQKLQKSSVICQKGESQNGCCKKTKHAKFSEKRTFLTPWYANVCVYFISTLQEQWCWN